MEKSESVANLIQFVVDSVRQAPADDAPFHHLQFDRIFPDDFYAQMLEAIPVGGVSRAVFAKKKRRVGWGRARAAFQGVAICFRPTVGGGAERPVRRKLRKGEHVSGTDPD